MTYTVTVIPGDGVGPDIVAVARRVLEAAKAPIVWEERLAGESALLRAGSPLPLDTLESIRRTKVCLKGPTTTPVGGGFRSVNVAIRKELDLYANVRPAKTYPGARTRYENVDLVCIRESTEDLYAGIEHMVGEDAAESIKIITRRGTERLVRFAMEYARREGRHKVTIVHKANIMKFTDGMFLHVAREVAAQYPDIHVEDRIVDNMSMQLVQKPDQYDTLVCPNLYGDILSDLIAGLIGGVGLAPSATYGDSAAVFETVHGSGLRYVGMNKVNPTAMILSAVLMLKHLGEHGAARRIEAAVASVIAEGKTVTYDLGGSAGTDEMGEAIARRLERGDV
ncbi:MAG: isocitrate/isopropylmalate dehydrogenase family protein [Dehalococcoidia bacterium]|nr:isocitrate/isopropylmalate dehydrogenase family protein [Dehalococcoidia bacterium]